MKIAVVGAGVSGLGAALALSDRADVMLFEKADRFGGHANTALIEHTGAEMAVDTGFLVFNERNYPNLCALFEHLGVASIWSDMSFGFTLDRGRLEYACDNLDTIFAQRRNAVNPLFLKGFSDIIRFTKAAPRALERGALDGKSLGEWLAEERFGRWFRDRFILPMGGAIWSTPAEEMLAFPARNFITFFANHDLFTGLGAAMQWRTVQGGSREYVSRIVDRLGARAHCGVGVAEVRRVAGGVELRFEDGSMGLFDQVILAGHAPQSRAMLQDMDAEERGILGAFRTTENRAYLHRDVDLMPKRRKVWSSWNFLSRGPAADAGRPATVSYWCNRLQSLDARRDVFVTLNPETPPAEDKTFGVYDYAHPYFDAKTFAAQGAMDAIQGRGGVWHAGAWLGYGFHEDGLRSGLRAAMALGAAPAWARDAGAPMERRFAVAAE